MTTDRGYFREIFHSLDLFAFFLDEKINKSIRPAGLAQKFVILAKDSWISL